MLEADIWFFLKKTQKVKKSKNEKLRPGGVETWKVPPLMICWDVAKIIDI